MPGDESVEHGDIYILALACLFLDEQSEEDARDSLRGSATEVCYLSPDEHRVTVLTTGEIQNAGEPQIVHIVTRAEGIGTILPVP